MENIPSPRVRTPSPSPDSAPVRELTPEPIGSHWVFSDPIRDLERRCVPFHIRGIRDSSDESLHAYDGDPAWTVPMDLCESSPREGEVIVNVVRRRRRKQISIHPRYLTPWVPVVGCEVVVVKGSSLLGVIGRTKERKGNNWVVTFVVDNDSRDLEIEEKDLATVEALVP